MKILICCVFIMICCGNISAQTEYELNFWTIRNPTTLKKIKVGTERQKYNIAGQITESKSAAQRTDYKYTDGLLTDSLNYSKEIFTGGKKLYYNEKKQLLREVQINKEHVETIIIEYYYGENGLVNCEKQKSSNPKYDYDKRTSLYFYDQDKRLIKQIDSTMNHEGNYRSNTTIYQYQLEDEDVVRTQFWVKNIRKNKLKKIRTETFNPKGFLIFEINHRYNTVLRVEYVYDENGNWNNKKIYKKESWPNPPKMLLEVVKTRIS